MKLRSHQPARGDQGGFTLLEMMLVSVLMVVVFSTLAIGLRAGHLANQEIERRTAQTLVADDLIDRLFRIDFGQPTDGAASGSQLTTLFDDDEVLGNVTLSNLLVFSGATGFQFELANFPWPGAFEVSVHADLNGDGDLLDANEGTSEVYRIDIAFVRPDGTEERVLECIRARPVG
jgi:prepilin-type N-terminal cleavage/methylation domain-containing protein